MNWNWKDYVIATTLGIIIILAMFSLVDWTIEKDSTVGVGVALGFIGAILGGFISGGLTLLGVRLTLNSSTEQVDKTLKEQQRIREEELENNAVKDQLFKLYHPLDSKINSYIFKYGAHDFSRLRFEEQLDFLNFITENEIYAEKDLYTKIVEIRWAFKADDYEQVNQFYRDIGYLLTEAISDMKDRLKLPNQEL